MDNTKTLANRIQLKAEKYNNLPLYKASEDVNKAIEYLEEVVATKSAAKPVQIVLEKATKKTQTALKSLETMRAGLKQKDVQADAETQEIADMLVEQIDKDVEALGLLVLTTLDWLIGLESYDLNTRSFYDEEEITEAMETND